MPRVTLQTIADRLAVSRTTVSNAWSRPDQLSPVLRERILTTAAELGYAGPDPVARSLRSGRVGAIGVLLTESIRYAFNDPYARSLFGGIATATEGADTGLLLVPLPPGQGTGAALERAAVDGVLAWSMPAGHPAVAFVRQRGTPLVTIDSPRLPDVPFVGIDDRAAARDITRRALRGGHEQILVLTFRVVDDDASGVVDDTRLAACTYRVTAERVGGALEAIADHGLPRSQVTVRETRLNHRDHAREQATEALRSASPPTLVVATSDELAVGAIQAARAENMSVPGDLAVTGFDDLPAAAEFDVTTVQQPAERKGQHAVARLLGSEPADDLILDHTIIERRSHRPAS